MNEELVQTPVTDVTENTDAQAEEQFEEGIELTDTASNEEIKDVKNYTDDDLERIVNERLNNLLPKKLEREKRKLEKQYSDKLSKYEETESILKAGLKAKDITDANKKMREFYKDEGIEIPEYSKPRYSDEDERVLGLSDADKIIGLGFEEMEDEANRLAEIGIDKMSPRDKALFNRLAEELTYQKNKRELTKLGVKDDVLNDSKFKEFASQFTSKTPFTTVYDLYTKTQPKPKVETIGSMKNINSDKNEVKDFYSYEEASKFTMDDYNRNPKLYEAVNRSMTKW